MRILLAIHLAYTDLLSGAARSFRTLMEWLVEGGHECRVLATANFDGPPPTALDAHLAECGGQRGPDVDYAGLRGLEFSLRGVRVTMLETRHNRRDRFDNAETRQFMAAFDKLRGAFAPQLVATYGSHPVTLVVLRRARRDGIRTLLILYNHGYDHPDWFADVDHVLVDTPYLSATYRQRLGLHSTGFAAPINWSEVLAPEDEREFVTFVNPSPHKGAAVFARIVAVLAQSRPDIPFLVVRSSQGDDVFRQLPEVTPATFRKVLIGPPTPRPADFFALTRLLLVPSLFGEPFGRVAAEALINGIPPLVSDRGALPQTVGPGGFVLPVPVWMSPTETRLPTAEEVQPWCDTICQLWDNAAVYAERSVLARQTAERMYSEAILKQCFLDYFAALPNDPRRPLPT